MTIALICSPARLDEELERTVLWRDELQRYHARTFEEARGLAAVSKPNIVVVDRDLPGAEHLVGALRAAPKTRRLSILVVARGEPTPQENTLLAAGANTILRLPAGPEWDARLMRLIRVPVRKSVRFLVSLQVQANRSDDSDVILALGRNLSTSGMLMDSTLPVDVGEELQLELQLPWERVRDPISGAGRVVRHAPPSLYGVEFRYLEPGGRQQLRDFLGTLSGS